MITKTFWQYGALAILVFATPIFAATAQTVSRVQLLDTETSRPISGATFQYGPQNGVTDDAGGMQFYFIPEETMQVSHLNYGQFQLGPADIRQMLEDKVLYRQATVVQLYPVTVIALHPTEKPADNMNLDYQERLAHDGAAVLEQNPAINSIRKGGNYGFDPVFRGFKYEQLNIVLNGAQGATAACPNRMDPPTSQMAPNMLERVEVLKGPHALRFGTGFGATLNFIPTALRFTEQPDVYGRLSNGFEGNGSLFRNEGQLGFSGKRHDLALFGSWSQGQDYTTGDGETVPAGFKRGSFGTTLGYLLSDSNQLRMSATYNLARDADFPALAMDLRNDDTWMFSIRQDLTFDKEHLSSWNSTIFASFVDHLMDNLLKPLDPRMLNASTQATTFNYGGRTEGVWHFRKARLYAGADFRREGADGYRTREFLMGPNAGTEATDNVWQEGAITREGLFAEYHINGAATQFVISSRWEFNSAALSNPAPEFSQVHAESRVTQFNPSISLGANRKIGREMALGLWLGRAQRSGGLIERYINYLPVGQDPYELLGNPALKAEKNTQLDLTYSWRREKTSLTADVFLAYLEDFISSVINPELTPRLPMSPGVREYVNIAEAFKTGFELQYTQQLTTGLQQQLGVAYTYAQDLEREQPLPEIAPLDLRYSLRGSFFKDKLLPELLFRQVLAQSRISPEYGETRTPSFSLLDIKVAGQLTKTSRLTLGVNNLFDTAYYEHLSRSVSGTARPINAPGQTFFASVSMVF